MLVSISLRNTLLHVKPFTQIKMLWVEQFSKFLTMKEYEVPGYIPPEVKINLHINLRSILFGYSHSFIVPKSLILLR